MRYKNVLLVLLLSGLMFTNLDRQVLGLAMEPIKLELSLSDTQLGLLTGIAFALFYSLLGFPIARLADRGDRAILISVTTSLSCIAVALCGFAASFLQLLIIRVLVAVGETGFVPTANSLIAEYFTREERPKAVSTYLLGGPLSVIVGFFAGGWLIEYYGWRTTFVLVGSPGLILALVTWFGMREPRRTNRTESGESVLARTGLEQTDVEKVPFGKFLQLVWGSMTFRQLLYSYAVMSFFDYGRGQWLPTLFIRSFGLDTGSVGTWLAIFSGTAGIFGIYLGGWLSTRYAAGNERLQLKAISVIYVICGLLSAAVCTTSHREMALALSALATIAGAATSAPFFAILQDLVPNRVRAQSTAFIFLVANLVGMGLGPLAAGALSDALHVTLGDESLRYTLLALSPGYLWCTWHTWRAADTVASDLSRVSTSAPATPDPELSLLTGDKVTT